MSAPDDPDTAPAPAQPPIPPSEPRFSAQTWISASVILVLVALASKMFGFVRDVLVARYFGAGSQVDAFLVALSLPMLVGGAVGIAVSTALVPAYRRVLARAGERSANQFASTTVICAAGVLLVTMIPFCLMPRSFIELVAPLATDATKELAAELTGWLALYVLGLSLAYVLTAVYHAFHHFKIPAFSDLLFNGTVIVVLMALALPFGIHGLVFAYVAGIFLCVAMQILFLARRRPPGFGFRFDGTHLHGLAILAIPILLIDFSGQVAILTENYFAAGITEGSIAALNFAKRLPIAIVGLLAINVSRAAFPTLSALHAENDLQAARDLFVKLTKHLLIVFIPFVVCFVPLRREIVAAIFLRGAFDAVALELTATAFLFYAAGFVFAALEPVFLRTCYAFSDSVTPLVAAVLSVFIIIALNYALTPLMGIAGIALSTNLCIVFRVVFQGLSIRTRLGGLALAATLKTLVASLSCALLAVLPVLFLPTKPWPNLVGAVLLFFGLYVGVAFVFMNKEIRGMWKSMTRTIRPGSGGSPEA